VAKQKPIRKTSKKGNAPGQRMGRHGNKYSPGELFMAGIGALLIVLFLGIVITSFLGE